MNKSTTETPLKLALPPVYAGSREYTYPNSCQLWTEGNTIRSAGSGGDVEIGIGRMVCMNVTGACPSVAAIAAFNLAGGTSDRPEDYRETAADAVGKICSGIISCEFK